MYILLRKEIEVEKRNGNGIFQCATKLLTEMRNRKREGNIEKKKKKHP